MWLKKVQYSAIVDIIPSGLFPLESNTETGRYCPYFYAVEAARNLTILCPIFTTIKESGKIGQTLLLTSLVNSKQRSDGSKSVALFIGDILNGAAKRYYFGLLLWPESVLVPWIVEQPVHSFLACC